MIILKDLTIGYRQKDNNKVVAEHINAHIEAGVLTCLIGPNGVGKSTLPRTLSAFQPPLGGKIFISKDNEDKGVDISTLTDKQMAKMIGVVLTTKPDVQNMTVEELVALGRSPYTGFWGRLHDEDKTIVEESIRMVGIEALKDRMVQTLSDGERQKMMIAKALAQQTPVIFLDEPTAFLDYPSKVDMLQLLHQLSREKHKTIFLSTHDLELALQISDTLWLMQPHEAPVIGTPKDLAANGALSKFIDREGIRFDRETLSIRVVKR